MKSLSRFLAFGALLWTSSAVPFVRRQNLNFPDPNVDPFYVVPANISFYLPGQVIRRRDIPSEVNSTYSANFKNAYQVLIRTTDGQDRPTATVSTIWVPLRPAMPAKIFAYNMFEDSDQLDCDPSWGWVTNSGSVNSNYSREIEGPVVVGWGLNQGYYMVSTDHEGPNSAYIVGRMEGRAILDGIRATINTNSLSTRNTTIATWGYSGGAHASVWTSTLAQQYAPELKIVGAAFGGTPIDPRGTFSVLNNGKYSSILVAAILGWANGYAGPGSYPDYNTTLNNLYTDKGRNISAQFRAKNFCVPNEEATTPPINVNDLVTTGDLLGNVNTSIILGYESLLMNVTTILPVPVPKFPRFEYHGTADDIVSYPDENQYVAEQCSQGANIQFWRIPGQDHNQAYAYGFVGAIQFIGQAFNGTTPKVTCGSVPNNTVLPLPNSTVAQQLFGPTLWPLLVKGITPDFSMRK